MEIRAFLALVVPFIVLVYLAVLLFIRAPRQVVLLSLLGGLLAGLLNIGFDITAYYAHWWNYTINDLTLHVPLPFYISQVMIYGSLAYQFIWRYWRTRFHRISMLLLIGIPIFEFVRDLLYNGLSERGYAHWESLLVAPINLVMWYIIFLAGYFLFNRLAPSRASVLEHEAEVSSLEQPLVR
jgi:hypothetical protein